MSKNRTHKAMKVTAYLLFLAGLGLSVSHIVTLFQMLGAATLTACAMPLFIDVPTLMGRVARGEQFAASTRRVGLKVQIVGGTLSLIANVSAGHHSGDKIAGVLIVVGYLFAEWFAGALRPAEDDAKAAKKAAASAAAKRGAATRKAKADAEAQRKADAAERRRIAREIREAEQMTKTFAETVAPVSPASSPTTYI